MENFDLLLAQITGNSLEHMLVQMLFRGQSYMNILRCLETLSLSCYHFNHISLYMHICWLKWEK
ncbi:hypothetical protein CsSME_00044717 [Camellia sinensis var. sinensis]